MNTSPLMTYSYINCRAFGHAWRLVSIAPHPDMKHAEVVTLNCIGDCKRHRIDDVSTVSGSLIHRDYTDVPKDYALEGSFDRDEFRAEVLRRARTNGAALNQAWIDGEKAPLRMVAS